MQQTLPTTTTTPTEAPSDPVEALRRQLGGIELGVLTEGLSLARLMREGSTVTRQKVGGFGAGFEACGWSAAVVAAEAHGISV